MSGPKYTNGRLALSTCDICGFQFRLNTLRRIMIKDNLTEIKACCECWNPSHPQLLLGEYPVQDAWAVRDPRPDLSYPQSRSIIVPASTLSAGGFTGDVTISIS